MYDSISVFYVYSQQFIGMQGAKLLSQCCVFYTEEPDRGVAQVHLFLLSYYVF